VGRFRQFVNAAWHAGEPASPWCGCQFADCGSGWDPTWNTSLPADTASLKAAMKCNSTFQNWTDTLGPGEPAAELHGLVHGVRLLCMGRGRLPTEAE